MISIRQLDLYITPLFLYRNPPAFRPFLFIYPAWCNAQLKLRKGSMFQGITGLGGMRGHFLISLMDVSQPLNRFMEGNLFVFFTSFLDQS
jgi:hypothetical protein